MHERLATRLVSWLIILLLAGCVQRAAPKQKAPAAQSAARAVALAESPPDEAIDTSETTDDVSDPEAADEPEPPPKFRPPDERPRHDDARLAAAGIRRFESKRLVLYTDTDPDIGATLPPVVNQLYDALVEYFGPMPPDANGAEFQITGYLIRDEALFREQQLLEGLPTLLHGKHVANRFWMREQQHDYFRRHLLLHECTHCFMTFVPGEIPPVWYMEGMAELFGTHRLKPDGTAEFRVMPTQKDDVSGWGRIDGVRNECRAGRSLTVLGVLALPHEAFFQPEAYAWSWALCLFLDSHPRYAARFRGLGEHLSDGAFPAKFHEAFAHEERNLSTEWTLYSFQLQSGYDAARAAIEFRPSKLLAAGESREATIEAARGWQDVGLKVLAGEQFEIAATGRFTLADDVKPWISEPQGISIQYFQGQPLGRLIACLDADPAKDLKNPTGTHLLRAEAIGRSARLTIPANGRLLFRVNDAWDSLDDNDGSIDVTIRRCE